jgi:spoIIIJ-associated protein
VAEVSEAGSRVRELLERIAGAAGVEVSVRIREDEEGVAAEYVGDDLALLIGHHGQTIDAIQQLEAMNALERKVVHQYLKGRRDIETYSEGQEPSRRLVVAPLVQ